jgi:hypothetical protein
MKKMLPDVRLPLVPLGQESLDQLQKTLKSYRLLG